MSASESKAFKNDREVDRITRVTWKDVKVKRPKIVGGHFTPEIYKLAHLTSPTKCSSLVVVYLFA